MSDIKFTSPSGLGLRFDSNGNLYLEGHLFDSIPTDELWWSGCPPTSLAFKSPDTTSTTKRMWMLDGSLHIQGVFHPNSTDNEILAGDFIIKDNNGNPIASFTDDGDLYLKGDIVNEGSCTAPAYNPSKWNDGSYIQARNNCYNYESDEITYTYAQPGRASGNPITSVDPDEVKNAAIDDGLVWKGATLPSPPYCSSGGHLVCLVIWPYVDYHWYRLDTGGKWSHKMGDSPATNKDNSDDEIDDPETCDRGSYTTFVGYFCTCGNNAFIR